MSTAAVPSKRPRIPLLDEIRGLCVLLMVIYHAFYTLGYIIGFPVCRRLFGFFSPAEPVFAALFILICGLCCHLSHNNLRRGGLLALAAAGVSAVTAVILPEEPIWFGVLHLLACCILLFALLHRPLSRLPAAAGLAICVALFLLCWSVPVQEGKGFFGIPGLFTWEIPAALVRQKWLYPLGLGRIGGVQSDYFPLLPWMFCFFAGSFIGRWVAAGRLPGWAYRRHLPPLDFLGRHALAVYILHQPLIYGAGLAAAALLGQFPQA